MRLSKKGGVRTCTNILHPNSQSKTEISVQISILKEYRHACIHIFGATSSLVVHATFQLAEVCTRSETYQFEAIEFYEFCSKHSEITEVVTKSKTTMRSLYVKQVTSTSTTTTTKETLERAISYSYEKYVEVKTTYSCTHETVLSHFKELFVLYYKASKVETAIKEMQKLLVECITKVTIAKELIETAKFLVEILVSCSFVKQAWELVRELRMQIVYKSTKNVSTCGEWECQLYLEIFPRSLTWYFRLQHYDNRATLLRFLSGIRISPPCSIQHYHR